MKRILIISLTWLSAILAACTHPANSATMTPPVITPSQTAVRLTEVPLPIGDGGLITGQPCQSPCFFGIRIGETSLNQVASSLENNGISPCYPASDTTIFCGKETINIAVGADSSTLIVDGIQYVPSIPITVAEVLREYGNPNFIYVALGDTPETREISLLLLWDSIRMRIDLPEIEEQSYIIESTTQIKWIIFLDETSYTSIATDEYTQPWKGYGAYQP